MRVIRMSATSGNSTNSRPFTLQFDDDGNLTGEDAKDNVINDRYNAKKHLTITTLGEKDKFTDKLAGEAIKLAQDNTLRGKRIVVFVRRPDDAKRIAKNIRDHVVESIDASGSKPKKVKNTPYADSVEVLTGTMRGLERDALVEKPVLKRFLDGDENPDLEENKKPVFLISTSAGEVGMDLNADHMVCDATTIDSFIQRIGRVNRRGSGKATVVLVHEKPKPKGGKPVELKGLDRAIANTVELLNDGMPLSPQDIAALKAGPWKDKYADACSPEPTTVPLTDILLDNWSMTSIVEPMPGRPEVGPWLRGIAEWEPPRTEIAWRAELDLEGFGDLAPSDVEEWFDTHRILTHETLSEKTSDVVTWFKARRKAISQDVWNALAERPVIIDRAGLEVLSLGNLINRLERGGGDTDAFLRGAQVIVPASFGGIRRGIGLLDPTEPKLDKGEEKTSPDEQQSILDDQQNGVDVADVRGRYREKIEKPEDGEPELTALVVDTVKPTKYARYALELASDEEKTVRLISYVPRIEKPELGQQPQTLTQHHHAARKAVDDILQSLPLLDEIKLAAQLAADWHDRGKKRERWQRLLIFPSDFIKPGVPMGKSGLSMKRDPRGYRHEFGSLREFTDAFNTGKMLDHTGKLINQDVFDLAMHLIATHHGRGRPHFPKGGFDPDCESRSDEIHTESICRFARLQRKYGWWHLAWLENLLRCADAMASSEQDAAGGEK